MKIIAISIFCILLLAVTIMASGNPNDSVVVKIIDPKDGDRISSEGFGINGTLTGNLTGSFVWLVLGMPMQNKHNYYPIGDSPLPIGNWNKYASGLYNKGQQYSIVAVLADIKDIGVFQEYINNKNDPHRVSNPDPLLLPNSSRMLAQVIITKD